MSNDNVVIEDLRRRYGGPGGFEAVRGVSFSVRPAELFALLGTNGAGKTSTLEVVEGLARPAAGAVRVLGHDPYSERSLVRPRIGIMLQEGGFASDLTVTETVRLWCRLSSQSRTIAEVLGMVGLDHRDRVAVQSLSGGERRRLDLALAIVGRPEVLFLDEPTTGLDPESRRSTWQLVRDLLADGTTIVLTTHYLEEVEALADRLAILHEGRVVTAGTPAEVVAAQPSTIGFRLPSHVDVAQLPASAGEPQLSGDRVVLRTDTLQRSLTDLLTWANERHIDLDELSARSASLEEAFLAVAGRSDLEEVPAR